MKISIFGAGYVGLVTAACFAEVGHEVICADVDLKKIERLQRGECPIYEPGLTELLQHNLQTQRLSFTTDIAQAIAHGVCLFIAVGTPPEEDGSADLQYVVNVATQIAENMQEFKIIIMKSTVPVGTSDSVRDILHKVQHKRGVQFPFSMVSNPEFLKEGAAIADFMQPDRIVLGIDDEKVCEYLTELYAAFADKLMFMDLASAELCKYAANAMLATRISFMNELSHIAEKMGANIEAVRAGIASDPRIGAHFLRAGCGYGGSCFPKDVRALAQTAQQIGVITPLLTAVEQVNIQQQQVLFSKLEQHFGAALSSCVIAVWGLAFKPNTDDLRAASSRVLIEALWQAGVSVRAYDPIAMSAFSELYQPGENLVLTDTLYAAAEGADAIVVVTEWSEFATVDWSRVIASLRQPVIIDGRNLYKLEDMQQLPIIYYSIGRPPIRGNI